MSWRRRRPAAPTHPDWFHNLLADPTATVEVGREQIRVRAIVTHGDGRASLYAQLSAAWQMIDDYQAATTREIPVVLLERAGLDPGLGRTGGVGRSVCCQAWCEG